MTPGDDPCNWRCDETTCMRNADGHCTDNSVCGRWRDEHEANNGNEEDSDND